MAKNLSITAPSADDHLRGLLENKLNDCKEKTQGDNDKPRDPKSWWPHQFFRNAIYRTITIKHILETESGAVVEVKTLISEAIRKCQEYGAIDIREVCEAIGEIISLCNTPRSDR